MKADTYFGSLQQISATASDSLKLTQQKIINFDTNWHAITCVAHEDCHAGVIVHEEIGRFYVVYTYGAHSDLPNMKPIVTEERLERARNDGDAPYEFAIGGHRYFIKKKHYVFKSKVQDDPIHVYDVYADGQCGFRALAMAQLQSVTLQDETQHFYDFVRLQMKMALETYRDAYIEAGGAEDGAHFLVAELEDSFALTKSVWDEEDNDSFIPVDPQNTTIMLDVQAGQIAADAFDKIVVIIHQNISEDGDMDEQWLLHVPQAYPDVDGPPLIILMRSYEDDAARNHYYGVTGDVDLSAKCELGMFTDYFVAQLPPDARRQINQYLLVPRNQ